MVNSFSETVRLDLKLSISMDLDFVLLLNWLICYILFHFSVNFFHMQVFFLEATVFITVVIFKN